MFFSTATAWCAGCGSEAAAASRLVSASHGEAMQCPRAALGRPSGLASRLQQRYGVGVIAVAGDVALHPHRAEGLQGGPSQQPRHGADRRQPFPRRDGRARHYFAAQKQAPIKIEVDDAQGKAGKAKADEVLCTMCHLGGIVGQNEIPKVAGQWPQYIKKQLQDFKAKLRTNYASNMTAVAATLSDANIENLSQYVGNLN